MKKLGKIIYTILAFVPLFIFGYMIGVYILS